MSDASVDNPHTVPAAAWSASYWVGNTASGIHGADRAEIAVAGGYPTFTFALPAERHDMARLVQALQAAFNAGKVARSGETARLIGPPR